MRTRPTDAEFQELSTGIWWLVHRSISDTIVAGVPALGDGEDIGCHCQVHPSTGTIYIDVYATYNTVEAAGDWGSAFFN